MCVCHVTALPCLRAVVTFVTLTTLAKESGSYECYVSVVCCVVLCWCWVVLVFVVSMLCCVSVCCVYFVLCWCYLRLCCAYVMLFSVVFESVFEGGGDFITAQFLFLFPPSVCFVFSNLHYFKRLYLN